MYEFHGWIRLAESTEESDLGGLDGVVAALEQMMATYDTSSVAASTHVLNGAYYLLITGSPNRKRDSLVEDAMEFVRDRLPGSWGLLYERDDEMPIPPGPNAFKVTVLARGTISTRLDPFLSPCIPVIED